MRVCNGVQLFSTLHYQICLRSLCQQLAMNTGSNCEHSPPHANLRCNELETETRIYFILPLENSSHQLKIAMANWPKTSPRQSNEAETKELSDESYYLAHNNQPSFGSFVQIFSLGQCSAHRKKYQMKFLFDALSHS